MFLLLRLLLLAHALLLDVEQRLNQSFEYMHVIAVAATAAAAAAATAAARVQRHHRAEGAHDCLGRSEASEEGSQEVLVAARPGERRASDGSDEARLLGPARQEDVDVLAQARRAAAAQ